jgi:hypothetical protein
MSDKPDGKKPGRSSLPGFLARACISIERGCAMNALTKLLVITILVVSFLLPAIHIIPDGIFPCRTIRDTPDPSR